MNRIGIVITVVLTCAVIATASAIVANFPLQQQTADSITTPTATPNDTTTTPANTQTPSSTPTPTNIQAPYYTPTPSGSAQPTQTTPISLSNLYYAELSYVYVGRTNSTGEGHDHFGFGIPTYPSTLYPVYVLLNLTYLGTPENEPYDAEFEGYLVTFFADTGVAASYIGWFGTNFNPSLSSLPTIPMPFPPSSGPHRDIQFHFNLTVNQSFLGQLSDGGSYGSSPSSLGLWSNGTPNTITVSVQRAGWVTANGTATSTITNPAKDVILVQIQLGKFGDGFVFGSIPSQK